MARPRRRAALLLLAALAFLLATGWAAARAWRRPATAARPAAVPAVDANTDRAVAREPARGVELVGSLAADEEVVVSAQVAGELSALSVDVGSVVRKGQVIARIDQRDKQLKVEEAEAALKQTLARLGAREGERFDPDQNAEVRIAKAQLDSAKTDLDRAARLVEKGDIARSVHAQAVTNHDLALARHQAARNAVAQQLAVVDEQRAALALSRQEIGETVVRAPIGGAVKEKHAARGTYLPVNSQIVTLVRLDPLRVRAEIPESAAAEVRAGQAVTLAVNAFPGRTFTARVVRIGPSLNERTRALTIEAEVSNPQHLLRPGMLVRSQVITAKETR